MEQNIKKIFNMRDGSLVRPNPNPMITDRTARISTRNSPGDHPVERTMSAGSHVQMTINRIDK
jgi:hypothetical protein